MKKRSIVGFVIGCVVSLTACQTSKLSSKKLGKLLSESSTFSQNHTGFVLYDLSEQKEIFNYQGNRYFQPASNTKILTYYVSQRTLGDSLPALKYVTNADSLIIWGTGDPSFLSPSMPASKVLDFLKNSPQKIYFSANNFTGKHYGPGWAWDDYNDDYASEITPLPIHGNVVGFKANGNSLIANPAYFQDKIVSVKSANNFGVTRVESNNTFEIPQGKAPKANFEQEVPFKTSNKLTTELLASVVGKPVTLIDAPLRSSAKTLMSLPVDTVFARMLHVSDNMMAEHLMLMCGQILAGELNVKKGIEKAKTNYLNTLPDAITWVDGSGLSRYNMITPRDLVMVLRQMYQEVPQEKLFKVFPAVGQSGTLKSLMPKTDKPFIFAKSGSFSNNYNLSGYLVTEQGKVLCFSLMNNNFVKPMSEIRKEVVKILTEIYQY
ncbi:D-alanyl-D-alanine carboxypeptidase/D-alanyl-D-alanine endopeptidase [Flectobacillus roseus]